MKAARSRYEAYHRYRIDRYAGWCVSEACYAMDFPDVDLERAERIELLMISSGVECVEFPGCPVAGICV